MSQSPTVPQSPTVTTRPSVAAKKVYSLGDDMFSVYHHKHYRVVSQLGSGRVNILSLYKLTMAYWLSFLGEAACSSQQCKEGKELSDRCNSTFTCRHIELVREGPASPPQSPILCETLR